LTNHAETILSERDGGLMIKIRTNPSKGEANPDRKEKE
jgi:hypothetical protein